MTWKTLATETLLSRAPWVEVTREVVEIRPGQVIDDFYQVRLMDFAMVIPFLEDGRVLLVEQYKHGPRKSILTFPAGHVDPGETGEPAAKRELMEETGLEAGELISLGARVDNSNQRVCTGHFFAALNCRQVAAPAPGDLEDFAYITLSPAEIDDAMRDGRFGVIHHVAAWGLWKLHESK
ncbi:NUDIX hydrolase [Marinovum sp. 2_MG-2023]|uniref:NUDIX hydrolase n=1 Tax=unclassified Marinovum TaxID=2647166 RepID=UPI0026E45E8E|nr:MULTISPECIES: NUDIX hydrolase [unclassified Marinovum]MDO6732128.1 NUDIX hydrolase [Marinovum sp. 2_MG-2023]MDO6781443.1 NUDIX hydrolase [Marinovum sp. 1_MG-2023]